MHITLESPNQPDVIALIAELDAYQDSLYPAEARYALDIASLASPAVLFAVARERNGAAVGCAAIVLGERYGEVKRMYVRPQCRGAGRGAVVGAGAGGGRSCAGLSCADAGNRALSARGAGVLRPAGLCALRPFWRVPRASAERFHEQATGRAGGQRRIPLLSESLNP